MRTSVAAGLAVLVLSPLAACTSTNQTAPPAGHSHRHGHHSSASSRPSASPSTPAPTGNGTASGTPSEATSPPPSQAAPAECSTAQLDASLKRANGAAGSIYVHLVLTNTGPGACVTGGYPGVSYVERGGSQLGAAAKRTAPRSVQRFTLAPGGRAASLLREVDTANFDPAKCRPAHVVALRVYPPDQTSSLLVKTSGTGCRNRSVQQLSVRPLQPLR